MTTFAYPARTETTLGGLRVRRAGPYRVTSWDGNHWTASYLESGDWYRYPLTEAADPSGGELFEEGRVVLRQLSPKGGRNRG